MIAFNEFNIATTRPIIILCEGKSEFAYIQTLNRLFKYCDEKSMCAVFKAVCINSGNWKNVIDLYKTNQKNNKGCLVLSFIDYDMYCRCKENKKMICEGCSVAKSILFSYMNFEDILMLHLDEIILKKWIKKCTKVNHFEKPLVEEKYLEVFESFRKKNKKIFPEEWRAPYSKGDLPFDLSKDRILIMIQNLKDTDCPIKFDLGSFLNYMLNEKNIIEFK